jgi:hypothetical protein
MRITVICLILAAFVTVRAEDLSKLPSPPANTYGFIMVGSPERSKVLQDNKVFIQKVMKAMWELTENDTYYGHIALGFNNFFENPTTDHCLYGDGLKLVYLAYSEDDSRLKQYIINMYLYSDLRSNSERVVASN